ncbi:hypothetical protein Vafri_6776 [Volvox africanus]|uniref:Pherophorin domain-containing protein n=1 Tax=Volvox africanus TaxID=51714 RepID=A0A8J4AZW4_9CHLO|nr:hypothetical protein Vafri_6776 [Volvox africanus]
MRVATLLSVALLATFGQVLWAAPPTGQFASFPYCECDPIGAYKLNEHIISKGNGTYCFTVKVDVPANCTSYCCTQADLRKIEFNVNQKCDIPGVVLTATLNGAATAINPNVEIAPQGPTGATIVKITQLGLNLSNADGAEICLTLGTNRGGKGCTTLEDLCVPPAGAPPGVCSAALFSSNTDCCPSSVVNPPPPPPPPAPCFTCINISLNAVNSPVPFSFYPALCKQYADSVVANFTQAAAAAGAIITVPFNLTTCNDDLVSICGAFASEADSQLLAGVAEDLAAQFLDLVTGRFGTCPPYLDGHNVIVSITGDADSRTCLDAIKSLSCSRANVSFPKCICDTKPGATPYAALPFYTTQPGRLKTTTQYCFKFTSIPTVDGACENATIFSKVEFWGNEALRRNIRGFAIKPNGATNYTIISASWGAKGDETVKATPLNWSIDQATGSEICMDIDTSIALDDFCLGPFTNGCYLTIFDPTRKCCPMFAIVDRP